MSCFCTRNRMVLIVLAVAASMLGGSQVDAAMRIERSPKTKLATFITATDGKTIATPVPAGKQSLEASDFLKIHGHLFGITNNETQLRLESVVTDGMGRDHSTFQQIHRGVPVFGGLLKVHQNADGGVYAANGNFHSVPERLSPVPSLTLDQAVQIARARLALQGTQVERSEIAVVDPGWYGDPAQGSRLAYYLILHDQPLAIREGVFVDAHSGVILDSWNMIHHGLFREVYDDSQIGDPLVRMEGDGPTGDFDADSGYDYASDWYDFFLRAFGRDSFDDAGATLRELVHLQSPECTNAFWNGNEVQLCDGTAADDVIGHEFGHAITGWTAQLIYQNQSGQLNESYSDVWGELVDLYNGDAAFAGVPGGTPWPTVHATGPGADTPNTMRNNQCATGLAVKASQPAGLGTMFASAAQFGPRLDGTGLTGDVVYSDPGTACNFDLPLNNAAAMVGRIVVVDRGGCNYSEKAKNVQDAGAIGVIVVNTGTSSVRMFGFDSSVVIPTVSVSLADGNAIKAAILSGTVTVTLRADRVRWLVFEDSAGWVGPLRDMWNPTCFGDPDRANHPNQTCNPGDNGGVHEGSGIPNHAFAILTDGKTFNGFTVNAIGPIKAGAVWYRALTTYLTILSDFRDAYLSLNQAATDLVGTFPNDPRTGTPSVDQFTQADADEVDKALRAVEMDTAGLCGAGLVYGDAPSIPGQVCSTVWQDDFESGINGWTTFNSGPFTPYDWIQVPANWPWYETENRAGTAWFAEDRSVDFNCNIGDETAVHSLQSPVIALPGSLTIPKVEFDHYFGIETGWDGGNMSIKVNAGVWQTIPSSAFQHNPYSTMLIAGGAGNTNPLAGQDGFSGLGGWGTSVIDLTGIASAGDSIQFRFDLGKDACNPDGEGWYIQGWFVDNLQVLDCVGGAFTPPAPGDDTCVGGSNDGGSCSTDADCPGGVCGLKSRYVSITPNGSVVAGSDPLSIQVTIVDIDDALGLNAREGEVWWAGASQALSNPPGADLSGAPLTCEATPSHAEVWPGGVLHLFGAPIVPGSIYEVRLCHASGASCSDPLTVATGQWGDAVAAFGGGAQPNFADVTALVDKFKEQPNGRDTPRTDLVPQVPNQVTNFADIDAAVGAFKEMAYPYVIPACP